MYTEDVNSCIYQSDVAENDGAIGFYSFTLIYKESYSGVGRVEDLNHRVRVFRHTARYYSAVYGM